MPARFGNAKTQPRTPWTADEFLAAGVRVGPCLEWPGYRDSEGYGFLRWKGRTVRAHRLALELRYGPIPQGLQVCHTCDNPPCIEPLHLFLGTNAQNHIDSQYKGRMPIGEARPQARLTDAKVRELRALAAGGMRRADLARHFGIRATSVDNVLSGRTWSHVDDDHPHSDRHRGDASGRQRPDREAVAS